MSMMINKFGHLSKSIMSRVTYLTRFVPNELWKCWEFREIWYGNRIENVFSRKKCQMFYEIKIYRIKATSITFQYKVILISIKFDNLGIDKDDNNKYINACINDC